VVDIHGLIL